jgi:hypothetical protein
MLRAESEKPMKVEVIVNSGEKGEKTFQGVVLGVESISDLAVIRVEGKGLPAPLPIGSAKNLRETDPVFIFGYPFGDNLGKNVTVSKSSVSSLRKDEKGISLHQIQVNGGMHPGNSGGPIIDDKGQLVGVAVSGIRNSTINFAIPAEQVRNFLVGGLKSQVRGLVYKQRDKVQVPLYVHFIDPLGRINEVWYEYWTGDPSKERGTKLGNPDPLPGDSERMKAPLPYKDGLASGELTMPAVPKGKVVWYQMFFKSGPTGKFWALERVLVINNPVDAKPAVVTYKHNPGTDSKWKLTSTSTLKIRDEDDVDHALALSMKAELNASTAKNLDAGDRATVGLKVSKIEVAVTVDKKPAGDTKEDDSLAKEAALYKGTLQIGKDGNVLKTGADLKGIPKTSQKRWAVLSERILQGIDAASFPLPGGEVTTSKTWTGTRAIPVGTIGPPMPAQANLTYVYKGTWTRQGREEAVVEFTGPIQPEKTGLLRVSGKVKGEAHIDLATGTIARTTTTVDLDMTMRVEGETSRASGTLEIRLERGLPAP